MEKNDFEKKIENFELFFLKIQLKKSIFVSKFSIENLLTKIDFFNWIFKKKSSKFSIFFSKSFFSMMKKYFCIIFEVLERSTPLLAIAPLLMANGPLSRKLHTF